MWAKYLMDVSIFEPETLIFNFVETGSDKRAALRKYGYALRGSSIREATCERRTVLNCRRTYGWYAGCVCNSRKCNADTCYECRVLPVTLPTTIQWCQSQ